MYNVLKVEKRLPIFQPADINTILIDSAIAHVKKFHKIANFKLLNQNGDFVTQDTYKDKIYVADFFFTTCASICPIMTDNMRLIQKEMLLDDEVMLLSHSVTPRRDSVPQLKQYAIEKGVIAKKWNLVTGDKKEIYDLARKSYGVAKTDGDGGPFDMIHTENFVLVDKEKRMRGFYDGTKAADIEKLLEDIQILKKEYEKE
jgi:protein SCO1/2